MESVPKRARKSSDLSSFLKPSFKKAGKWCVVYLCLALDCDVPVLDAILWTSYAVTGFKEKTDGLVILDTIKAFLADRIALLRSDWCPDSLCSKSNYWHPIQQTTTGKDGIKILFDAKLGRLNVENIDKRLQPNQQFVGVNIQLDYTKDRVKINSLTPNLEYTWHHVPWGKFIPFLEEEIERFRPHPIE